MKPFTNEFLTKNVLELIFKRVSFKESHRQDRKSPPEYLYTYGKGCNYFILILSGEATIEVGKEKLEFPAGPFTYFGVNALLCGSETADEVINEESKLKSIENKNVFFNESKSVKITKYYVPDFSLRIDDRCVYMKLDRELWRNGVIKSRYEIRNNELSDHIDYNPTELVNHFEVGSKSEVASSNSKSEFMTHSPANLVRVKPGRRSTIAATALAKAQKAASASKSGTPQSSLKVSNKMPDTLVTNDSLRQTKSDSVKFSSNYTIDENPSSHLISLDMNTKESF